MKPRNLLLSHSCQIAGWVLLALLSVFLLFWLALPRSSWDFIGELPFVLKWAWITVAEIWPYLAITLLCLSREKHEDEYVQHIRSVSVFCLALFLLLIGMFSFAFERLFIYWGLNGVSRFIVGLRSYFSLIPVAAVLYLIIFKGLLFYNWIKSRANG